MPTTKVTARMAFISRSFLVKLALAWGIVLIFALLSRAGGPKGVAGTSYFNSAMAGKPLVWPQGLITYYTDQGDLSPVLPNASANAFVTDAFSQWTSVPTAALTAVSGGELAEDVDGSNVTVDGIGNIAIPADVQPTATSTPVGVVYDYDGAVTNALLGEGAGDPSQCFLNAVFGGDDNFGQSATYQHALIVINGQCAQASSQLVDVEYRLVRIIGEVLGVGWSQVNPNVLTGSPPVTADDYAGFPVMHNLDPSACVPITRCYTSPYQLSMDDMAAISRLYPVTGENQSSFPGKQVFATATARIHGSVWFTDRSGNATQPMQGVNVVARWIDPTTNLPSRRYAASSVSGFLFTGNAGNPISGLNDALGDPYNEWGASTPTLEGFFDLAGLQLPQGGTAQYQLSVEPLDPIWSVGVGSYAPWLVGPSGLAQPIVVTVTAGQDVKRDILMAATAQPIPDLSSESWTAPAPVPPAGEWAGSLSGYGDLAYFLLPVRANRTLSVGVTALNEGGNASDAKTQPVIGMWSATDPQGTAPGAYTSSPFNTLTFGLTRLDAQVTTSANFLIGISDVRGDGRPDYHYQAHVLYADSVSPARVSANGGAVTVLGRGFAPGFKATIGGAAATPLAVTAGQMILAAPAHGDGALSISIADPATGASSTMTNVLNYGALASDNIILVGGGLNPPTPVGTQATNPVSVRVLAADGVTPVSGATIGWSGSNGVQLSACASRSACSVVTDEGGNAATRLTPATVATATITATLAPGVYNPPKLVSATLSATESAADIGVLTPYLWIAQGATVSIPLTARVLSKGVPQSKSQVNYTTVHGTGMLSAASAQTDSGGYATVMLSVSNLAALVQVSACIAPANSPCQPIYANPVPLANQRLQPVSGAGQVSTGEAFQPIVMRVTDASSPPNFVLGATVGFLTTVLRPNGDSNPANPTMPVILSVSQSTGITDLNGVASIVPSNEGFSAPLEVDVGATAGTSAELDYPLQILVDAGRGNAGTGNNAERNPMSIGRSAPTTPRTHECGDNFMPWWSHGTEAP